MLACKQSLSRSASPDVMSLLTIWKTVLLSATLERLGSPICPTGSSLLCPSRSPRSWSFTPHLQYTCQPRSKSCKDTLWIFISIWMTHRRFSSSLSFLSCLMSRLIKINYRLAVVRLCAPAKSPLSVQTHAIPTQWVTESSRFLKYKRDATRHSASEHSEFMSHTDPKRLRPPVHQILINSPFSPGEFLRPNLKNLHHGVCEIVFTGMGSTGTPPDWTHKAWSHDYCQRRGMKIGVQKRCVVDWLHIRCNYVSLPQHERHL